MRRYVFEARNLPLHLPQRVAMARLRNIVGAVAHVAEAIGLGCILPSSADLAVDLVEQRHQILPERLPVAGFAPGIAGEGLRISAAHGVSKPEKSSAAPK